MANQALEASSSKGPDAEQNLIGVATGLSELNFKVITTTFSPFQTLRCCEQIKVNLGYMKQKVCLVGLASGVVLGSLGYLDRSGYNNCAISSRISAK